MENGDRARIHELPHVRAIWTGRDGKLRVGVDRKVSSLKLTSEEMVPKAVGDRETDVVEIRNIKPRLVPHDAREGGSFGTRELNQRRRPCPGGFSCGHYAITAGTLGCWVKGPSGEWVILSNNHVLANSNEGVEGDRITQPGPYDLDGLTTQPENWIGHLQSFVTINTEGGGGNGCSIPIPGIGKLTRRPRGAIDQPYPNVVDAAIARPFGTAVDPEIHLIGQPSGMRVPAIGEPVKKSGRTTEFTSDDQIEATDLSVQVGYGSFQALFANQLLLISEPESPFSQPGDSGSAWIAQDDDAMVGLLFAGGELEDGRDATIANNITYVRELLGVSL